MSEQLPECKACLRCREVSRRRGGDWGRGNWVKGGLESGVLHLVPLYPDTQRWWQAYCGLERRGHLWSIQYPEEAPA